MQEFDTTYGMIDGGCWTLWIPNILLKAYLLYKYQTPILYLKQKEELAKNASYINHIRITRLIVAMHHLVQ